MPTGGQEARSEDRETVMLRAQVIDAAGSREAGISDISSLGLLGNMAQPPGRGEFVIIRFGAREVAGQVRWVNGRRFGVRLGERVDAPSLKSGRNANRQVGKPLATSTIEDDKSLKSLFTVYSVLGLTALSAAYLIVSYVIY